jgi:hypothetical protein
MVRYSRQNAGQPGETCVVLGGRERWGTGWLRQSRCTRIWGLGRESGPQIERRNVFRGAAGAADGVFKCQVAGAGEGDSYATGCRGKRCIGEE